MRPLLLLFLCVASIFAEDMAFHGRPRVRVFSDPGKEQRETLDSAAAEKNECVIVSRGKKYFWASREDAPLTRVDAQSFTYFIHMGGGGYVKVYTGESGPVNEAADYIEHINRGFETVTYWGKVVR